MIINGEGVFYKLAIVETFRFFGGEKSFFSLAVG